MIIEPGQVSMLGCYVLAGYTLNHWLSQPRFWTSVRQTLPAFLCGGIVATLLAVGPDPFQLPVHHGLRTGRKFPSRRPSGALCIPLRF